MNVYLPIINETLVSSASIGETNFYLQPIPVWPTRSYTITITPENPAKDVEISILQGGVNKFSKTIPYSPKIEFDLSIAGTVIPPLTRDQSLVNGGGNDLGMITIAHNSKYCLLILFNADVPVHMMPAIGGTNFRFPTKPRIPGQPYDIIMPSLSWEDNGLTNYDITCEPVDDYHGPHVFPTKYYLGSTIDIRYIKKLTVKSPNTGDTVAVAEYENKLPQAVANDDQMLCAARLRWNMRNGQWMWYAFKDYFWNEGFTYMRGLGGASEQGILTINVAYTKEYYLAFQELLVSSNIELTLPKQFPTIDEEQRYKMEVTSDTGARWSGSERAYRQQITLRTIGFMDNYIPPVEPDAPAIIPVAFTAFPYEHTYPYFADINGLINVTSNVKWDLVPQVDWLFPVAPADGKGNIGVTPVATRRTVNPNTVRRVGYIHFLKAGTAEQIGGIKVNQNGAPAVNATPKFLPVSPEGELKSFVTSCATAGQGTLQVKNMSGAAGAWANLDASGLDQNGGSVYVKPARNLPETGGVPRSCIIRTTHDITGQFADVNVMQSAACPVDRFPNDFAWAGKGMYAYDGNAHKDNEFTFTSGIPYTAMVGECDEAFISNIRIVRVEPNIKLVFNMAVNSGTGANVDRFARIRVKHVPTGKVLGTVVAFQRAYSGAAPNFVYASWNPAEAADGSMHYFDLITAASMVPSLIPPSQARTHNIDSLNVNGVQLNRFRVMLDWNPGLTRTINLSANVTGASGNIPIIQYSNVDATAISSNQIWHRLDPVWVLSAPNERTAEIAVQARKLNQRDEISFFRLDSWVTLDSTAIDPNNNYIRKFNLRIAANTTGAARGTEIRFQRPGISDIIIRIEQAG
ncbi:hypothetical protein BC679P5_00008 [Bacteroides phage BC679P5]|nr:hypothetical protein BC679P5_00008 [Bacteroides phage BC679P5]